MQPNVRQAVAESLAALRTSSLEIVEALINWQATQQSAAAAAGGHQRALERRRRRCSATQANLNESSR